MACPYCKGTGWCGYEKPMTGTDGKVAMVFVPQTCMSCEKGRETWLESQRVAHSSTGIKTQERT